MRTIIIILLLILSVLCLSGSMAETKEENYLVPNVFVKENQYEKNRI